MNGTQRTATEFEPFEPEMGWICGVDALGVDGDGESGEPFEPEMGLICGVDALGVDGDKKSTSPLSLRWVGSAELMP